jgi:hypothetical protein
VTPNQPIDAQRLIPTAFERNAPPHRGMATTPAAAALETAAPGPPAADALYVIAAPSRPTTWLGQTGAALGDVAAAVGVIFTLVLAPILVVSLVAAAIALILEGAR